MSVTAKPESLDMEVGLIESRSKIYDLLAHVFYKEPGPTFLQCLRDSDTVHAFNALGLDFPEEIEKSEREVGLDATLEALACEYTRLFIGPGPHLGPYESLHRSDEQKSEHWGASTAKVKRFIEHQGLSYCADFQDMPDHIAVEFQFMSLLSQAEAEALGRDDFKSSKQAHEIQKMFYCKHLGKWAPTFLDQVTEAATLSLYRDFSKIAKELCNFEEQRFKAK
jgi:putative dimethyl sulfoxide reductase chaperone